MNRMKNICILIILTLFLLMIKYIPVTCIFKQVTGISCPSCGMTRAFYSIFNLKLIDAFLYNILSIPLFIFIVFSFIILLYEIITNKFEYIPKVINVLSNKISIIIIIILLTTSFILKNIG